MKAVVKGFIGVVASLVVATSALAEGIAVVDIQGVVAQMPQAAQMQQALQAEFAVQGEEIKKLEADIKYNMDKLKREAMTMSAEQQDELKKAIDQQRMDYQAKVQPLQQQMRQRQAQEQNKILALVKQAIDAVAAEKKYDVVLDAKAVTYVAEGKDITAAVVERVSKTQ